MDPERSLGSAHRQGQLTSPPANSPAARAGIAQPVSRQAEPASTRPAPMAAAASGADGAPLRSPSLQPGNLECVEQFTQFCLHGASSDEYSYSSNNNNNHILGFSDDDDCRSRSASPRASVSTAASSIDSCLLALCSDPDLDAASLRRSAPTRRSRRDKKALHAARQQRSESNTNPSPLGSKAQDSSSKPRWLQRRASSTPADALAALEPAHDQGLARMTFAEQQRWITVQQKTFTKWCASQLPKETRQRRETHTISPQAEYQVGRTQSRGQGPGG